MGYRYGFVKGQPIVDNLKVIQLFYEELVGVLATAAIESNNKFEFLLFNTMSAKESPIIRFVLSFNLQLQKSEETIAAYQAFKNRVGQHVEELAWDWTNERQQSNIFSSVRLVMSRSFALSPELENERGWLVTRQTELEAAVASWEGLKKTSLSSLFDRGEEDVIDEVKYIIANLKTADVNTYDTDRKVFKQKVLVYLGLTDFPNIYYPE